MRFGLNTFLANAGFSDSSIEVIQQFKSYGADAIELAIADPSAVTPSKVNEALSAAGLEKPLICGAFSLDRDLRGSPEQVENSKQYIRDLIAIAKQIDSPLICGPMYSGVGRANPHTPEERAAQLDQIVEKLKPLCDEAQEAGVTLAVEPLNRFETDCINTLAQGAELIERVGSDALKMHIDTFHMHIEEADSAAAILEFGKYIGHVHASGSNRGVPGTEQVAWKPVISALKEIGYTGDIIIESFASTETIIAQAASIWRDLYESPKQLSVDGLSFLRETWKSASN